MQTKITIRNEAHTCYIDIEGTIGVPEKHQFENAASRVATFETFQQEVARIAQVAASSVVVNIRSTGGDVNDALLIYEALQGLDARITTRCYGYTASAATIIAQAADEGCREISSNALYLIHNSTCAIEGNASSLESRAELLRKTDERLAYLYAQHSAHPVEEFEALMAENNGSGRWLTAEETLQAGLADKIIDSVGVGSLLPDLDPDDAEAGGGALVPASEDVNSDTPAVEDSAAGQIIRYILSRLAYRLEEWLESLHQKQVTKRKERRAEKAAERAAEKAEKAAERDAKRAAKKAAKAEKGKESSAANTEGDNLPKAAAVATPNDLAASHKSAIAFTEGQRRYAASAVKATEDPSMARPNSAANEKAYADDAKAFFR
ncbi:MAG: Clp protease ClpP [Tidjanibacter sp.]|nr:Clp protease ClpP [Tidjanibacter sp.]